MYESRKLRRSAFRAVEAQTSYMHACGLAAPGAIDVSAHVAWRRLKDRGRGAWWCTGAKEHRNLGPRPAGL
jgi:hypothetical protein